MREIKDEILNKLKSVPAPPFLFVGSGISQRYIGAPTWIGLLEYFAKLSTDSEFAYQMYNGKAIRGEHANGIEPKIAELIEEDFNDKWYISDDYKESRQKYKDIACEGCSPLKIEIADLFNKISNSDFKEDMIGEIKLLEEVADKSIAGIITTNYDCIIERIFSKYKYSKYVGQEELLFQPITGISEIYKIHGCCLDPNSIVINDKDYQRFNERNAYLVAKLLTIFLEYPIIFIGYKIGDTNIKEILISIAKCLSKESLEKLEDRFIFVEWNDTNNPDSVSKYEFTNLGENKSILMTKLHIKDFSILYETLLENKVSYNPRLIKKLKKDIYNVVLESTPSKTLNVLMDIEDDRLDEVEAVVGFGVMEQLGYKGYKGIEAKDLFNDVIYNIGFEGKPLNHKVVVEESLPNIIKHNQSIPMHKYIQGYVGELHPSIVKHMKTEYDEYLTKGIKKDLEKGKITETSILELRNHYNYIDCLKNIPRMKKEYIYVDELYDFIVEVMENNMTNIPKASRTDLNRLVKIYDFMRYYEE